MNAKVSALFIQLVKRECLLRWRAKSEASLPCVFFLIISCIFPLAQSIDVSLLSRIGVGVVWIAILLALFMSLFQLFQADYLDGSLDQFLLLPIPLSLAVFAKMVAHWAILILPMILISPVVGLMYHLTWLEIKMLILSLLLGTPILVLLGAVLAGLTVGLRQQGLLLALLILPLYVPTLIFASSLVFARVTGGNVNGICALLGAFLLASIAVAPTVTAATLSIGMAVK